MPVGDPSASDWVNKTRFRKVLHAYGRLESFAVIEALSAEKADKGSLLDKNKLNRPESGNLPTKIKSLFQRLFRQPGLA